MATFFNEQQRLELELQSIAFLGSLQWPIKICDKNNQNIVKSFYHNNVCENVMCDEILNRKFYGKFYLEFSKPRWQMQNQERPIISHQFKRTVFYSSRASYKL